MDSTIHVHLVVDGHRLRCPEGAFIRLLNGQYEFVLCHGPMSIATPLVKDPLAPAIGTTAHAAVQEAGISAALGSAPTLSDVEQAIAPAQESKPTGAGQAPELQPAQQIYKPCFQPHQSLGHDMVVDDTQDIATGEQPSQPETEYALPHSSGKLEHSRTSTSCLKQLFKDADPPTAAQKATPPAHPPAGLPDRPPSAQASDAAAKPVAAPLQPASLPPQPATMTAALASAATPPTLPASAAATNPQGLVLASAAACSSLRAAVASPTAGAADAPRDPAASAQAAGPEPAAQDSESLDHHTAAEAACGPAADGDADELAPDQAPEADILMPDQAAETAALPAESACRAEQAVQQEATHASDNTSTDYQAPLALLASTASSPRAKAKTGSRGKSSLGTRSSLAGPSPPAPQAQPTPKPLSTSAPAASAAEEPAAKAAGILAPALQGPAAADASISEAAGAAASSPTCQASPLPAQAAADLGAEQTPQADAQHTDFPLLDPVEPLSPEEDQAAQGKENAAPPRQALTSPASGKQGKKQKSPHPLTSVPTGKRSKTHRSSSPQQPLAGFCWKKMCDALPAGEGPCRRWGHTLSAISETEAILVGGAGLEGPLADSWLLDLPGKRWLPYSCLHQRPQAWHAASVATSNQARGLFVLGGERALSDNAAAAEGSPEQEEDDEEVTEVLAELSALDLRGQLGAQEPWYNLPLTGAAPPAALQSHKGSKGRDAATSAPPERAGHTLTRLPSGNMLVFGGMDDGGRWHNDLWEVNLNDLHWFSLKGIASGAPPKPRAYHSATLVGDLLVVLGGSGKATWSLKEVYTLSIPGYKWSERTSQVEGEPPCPRGGHTAIALEDQRHLLVFGGGNIDNGAFHSGIALLDTATWRWSTPSVEGMARPTGRLGHASVMLKDQQGCSHVVVYGGRAMEDSLCEDTWILQLPSSLQETA